MACRTGLSKMLVKLKNIVLNGSLNSPESDGCPECRTPVRFIMQAAWAKLSGDTAYFGSGSHFRTSWICWSQKPQLWSPGAS
jgi:hypothetical protein